MRFIKETIGIILIIVGEVLYFLQSYLSKNYTNLNDFISGLLLGISIGLNLLGIIISVASISMKRNRNT